MILVDTPRWPAHGTVYGHLVSDESLWELHDFAHALGLDPRAFDHDHYDLAEDRWQPALAQGALLLDERELVVRLRTGGLRVLPADHAPRRRRARARVAEVANGLLSGWGAAPGQVADVVHSLLEAHTQPGRRYHDLRHVDEMLRHLETLARADGLASAPVAEQLAAVFHDVVYEGRHGEDERASAGWAVDALRRAGAPAALVQEVERLVLLTAGHRPAPDDPAGARVSDADMAILASVPGRYHVSVRDIRLEYARVSPADWRAGRRAVLDGFLAQPCIFHTAHGHAVWEERARANVADERAHPGWPSGAGHAR